MMNFLEFAATCASLGEYKALDMNWLHELPCYFYMKDGEGRYIGVNDYLRKDVGLSSIEDLYGASDFELCKDATAAALRQNDHKIKTSESAGIFVEPITFLNSKQVTSISYKAPLRARGKKIIGVIGLSIVSYPMLTPEQAREMAWQGVPSSINGYAVTQKEREVLYWLVRRKTAREIAAILMRSQRTIEHHIENIKIKTQSASKSELINKIIGGY